MCDELLGLSCRLPLTRLGFVEFLLQERPYICIDERKVSLLSCMSLCILGSLPQIDTKKSTEQKCGEQYERYGQSRDTLRGSRFLLCWHCS